MFFNVEPFFIWVPPNRSSRTNFPCKVSSIIINKNFFSKYRRFIPSSHKNLVNNIPLELWIIKNIYYDCIDFNYENSKGDLKKLQLFWEKKIKINRKLNVPTATSGFLFPSNQCLFKKSYSIRSLKEKKKEKPPLYPNLQIRLQLLPFLVQSPSKLTFVYVYI